MRVGIPDGNAAPRPRACPGASFLVTPEDYRELERRGLRWATRSNELEREGKSTARTLCTADAQTVTRMGVVYTLGLCAACDALEERQRLALRARFAAPA